MFSLAFFDDYNTLWANINNQGEKKMALKHANDANFSSMIGDGITLVDFWATWCGPCRMVGPVIDELAKEYEGKVVIGKCNVDDNEDLTMEFGIRNIPTVLFFKNGQVVDKQVGSAPKPVYVQKIEALL